MTPDPSELPEFVAWRAQRYPEADLIDYGCEACTPTQIVAAGSLLWPDLIEHDGCVLLAGSFEEANFAAWKAEFEGKVSSIEAMLNHRHLWDLFAQVEDDDPGLDALLALLARTWRAKLERDFPDRVWRVETDDGTNEYGPTITFFSESGPPDGGSAPAWECRA